jgi:hypothetical protein
MVLSTAVSVTLVPLVKVTLYGIAIDGSGDVWVASDDNVGPLAEFVGAAVPVVTPLAAGATYKQLGTRP